MSDADGVYTAARLMKIRPSTQENNYKEAQFPITKEENEDLDLLRRNSLTLCNDKTPDQFYLPRHYRGKRSKIFGGEKTLGIYKIPQCSVI